MTNAFSNVGTTNLKKWMLLLIKSTFCVDNMLIDVFSSEYIPVAFSYKCRSNLLLKSLEM